MKRFGTIFPFLERGSSSLRMGRLVANHDFIKALLARDSFDEYIFSNPSVNNLKAFKREVENWGLSYEQISKIRYVPYASLISTIQQHPFHVFHLGGWGYFMPGLHFLRNQFACNPWPITGVIHSLNGRTVIDQAVRLCHAQLASYDDIFCTSKDGQQAMENLLQSASEIAGTKYLGHLDLVPLGVSDELPESKGDREKMRDTMNIPESAIVLLMMGRITPIHKMDPAPFLIQFARQILPTSKVPIYLIMAGGTDSSDLQLLKKQVKDCGISDFVKVRANFHQKAKSDLLAAADIFLSLSDNTQETFGLSILEAQCAGLPVVASRFDGFKDLVRDGIDGFLIDTYGSSLHPMANLFDLMDPNVGQLFQAQSVALDMPQLFERISLLIENAELRKTMGAIGKSKVMREFLWSRIIRKYEYHWDRRAREATALGVSGNKCNPFNFDQFRIFGHYATRILQLEDKVEKISTEFWPAPYEEIENLVSQSIIENIWDLAGERTSIRELMDKAHLPNDQAWFAITWMIKYNLFKVTPG